MITEQHLVALAALIAELKAQNHALREELDATRQQRDAALAQASKKAAQ